MNRVSVFLGKSVPSVRSRQKDLVKKFGRLKVVSGPELGSGSESGSVPELDAGSGPGPGSELGSVPAVLDAGSGSGLEPGPVPESGSVPELDSGSGSGPPKKKLTANTVRKLSLETSSKLKLSGFPANGYCAGEKNISYQMYRRGPRKPYDKVT